MEHAITIHDVLIGGGIVLGICVVLGIVVAVLSAIADGYRH